MLRLHSAVFIAISLVVAAPTTLADVYELRTYTTNEGKLENLHARFRNHTIDLFTKHGMESIGYWVPTDGETASNTLVYVLKHESREAATKSWAAFLADADWKKAFADSRVNGPLLAKAPDSVFMEETDYSTKFENGEPGTDVVFELRTYRCNEGKLGGLDARFRDHTIKLFQRHGIQSVAYWHPTDAPDSADTLIYIVKHASRDSAKTSWKAFSADPDWKKVAKESQQDGPFLRERPESVYLKATDYSVIQ